jgi:hypothetical protein
MQASDIELAPLAKRVHVNADANLRSDQEVRLPVIHQERCAVSAGQDLVEQRLGLVLVRLLGEGQLADEDLPGLGEHPLLAR